MLVGIEVHYSSFHALYTKTPLKKSMNLCDVNLIKILPWAIDAMSVKSFLETATNNLFVFY